MNHTTTVRVKKRTSIKKRSGVRGACYFKLKPEAIHAACRAFWQERGLREPSVKAFIDQSN